MENTCSILSCSVENVLNCIIVQWVFDQSWYVQLFSCWIVSWWVTFLMNHFVQSLLFNCSCWGHLEPTFWHGLGTLILAWVFLFWPGQFLRGKCPGHVKTAQTRPNGFFMISGKSQAAEESWGTRKISCYGYNPILTAVLVSKWTIWYGLGIFILAWVFSFWPGYFPRSG